MIISPESVKAEVPLTLPQVATLSMPSPASSMQGITPVQGRHIS
jgi:hypothetical protein